MAFKTFVSEEVLTASDVNSYLTGGVVAYASASGTNQTVSITGPVDITGVTDTFTAVSGRLYEISAVMSFHREADDGLVSLLAVTDLATIHLAQDFITSNAVTAEVHTLSFTVPFTTTAGARTIKLQFEHSGDETFIDNTFGRNCRMVVKDIGLA